MFMYKHAEVYKYVRAYSILQNFSAEKKKRKVRISFRDKNIPDSTLFNAF